MPFKSRDQRAWMHANKPAMAKRWEKHTPKGKKLPKKKTKSESIADRIDAVLEGERSTRSAVVISEFKSQLELALSQLAEETQNGTS